MDLSPGRRTLPAMLRAGTIVIEETHPPLLGDEAMLEGMLEAKGTAIERANLRPESGSSEPVAMRFDLLERRRADPIRQAWERGWTIGQSDDPKERRPRHHPERRVEPV